MSLEMVQILVKFRDLLSHQKCEYKKRREASNRVDISPPSRAVPMASQLELELLRKIVTASPMHKSEDASSSRSTACSDDDFLSHTFVVLFDPHSSPPGLDRP
nr:hypothetical protein CFP56_71713 [Quercus suber]